MISRAKRLPCKSCPWRLSTTPGSFPGGGVDGPALLRGARGGLGAPPMQCHVTPDGPGAQACVGFALVVGFDSAGLRLAAALGRYDPDQVDTDEDLHSLESLLLTHGVIPHEKHS